MIKNLKCEEIVIKIVVLMSTYMEKNTQIKKLNQY